MAGTNDFLPFAGGGSANVLTQAQYAALTSLLANGFSSGTAQSNQLNKVWRQSSIMAALIGSFIANASGNNVVDDGTTTTILGNLVIALGEYNNGTDTGVANAYVVNPPLTLPALVDGMPIRFKAANANTGACTLNWSGTGVKTLQGMSGALQGGEILAGQTYDCVWSAGLAAWVLVGQTGGALQVANAGRSQQSAALGQTLAAAGIQDVKASRAVGTVYTNSLARPIFVMIAASVTTAGDAAMMVVGGVNVVGSSAASTGPACTVGAMVPPGATYNLTSANNGTAGISTILTWVEDR